MENIREQFLYYDIDLPMVHSLLLYHDITTPPKTVHTNICDCIGFKAVKAKM